MPRFDVRYWHEPFIARLPFSKRWTWR